MHSVNRRTALSAVASAVLAGCGGGDEADVLADGAANAAAGMGSEQAMGLASNVGSRNVPQYLLWDGGTGCSRDYWSRHLLIRWKNPGSGDWLDASGRAQGGKAYASFSIGPQLGVYEVDITALVAKWITTGQNKGAFLRASGGTSTYASLGGRLAVRPPQLEVRTSQGNYLCTGLLSSMNPSTIKGLDTRASARLDTRCPVLAQFDLAAVRGTVQRAVMRLDCLASRYTLDVNVYEVDAPRFQLGGDGATARLGLAAQVGEAGLRTHPAVLRAGDFSNLNRGVLFDTLEQVKTNPGQQLPDPDAPGTVMFRGSFAPGVHGSFSGRVETMRASATNPLRPPAVVNEEMYCRLYIYLEDDWNSTLDANKMAIGWDLRMGWWNDAQGGYWQCTTGNGGAPGTGLKMLARAKKNGMTQAYDRWEYQGHSIRMEAGQAAADGNPYADLRPMQSYVYNLDQATRYGDIKRLGSGVIGKNRWFCLEQRIKMNSIAAPFDALGNGIAVADGELDTWLDGVLVSQVRGLRWRRHREMGIEGPWLNWYFGGSSVPDMRMHYRMNHLVVARQYIGPRVA